MVLAFSGDFIVFFDVSFYILHCMYNIYNK